MAESPGKTVISGFQEEPLSGNFSGMSEGRYNVPVWKIALFSFATVLAAWIFISWPLPLYLKTGVPARAHPEPAEIQRMIPGDHIQFMYYCWLAGDMLFGETPLFFNIYEFNTGNDRERFEPDAYYFPFSIVYALAERVGGRAFGWNITGLFSLWITYLLTWLLARRWTDHQWVSALAALFSIALPFRWINLFGGSPAGFAMAWVPAVLLGVDIAVREEKVRGGILAGAALLMASWGDKHVFFFSTLAVPLWGLIALSSRANFRWQNGDAYRALALALLPVAFFVSAALMFPYFTGIMYRSVIGASPAPHSVGARSMREVLLFSPDWRGLFGIGSVGAARDIYLGFTAPLLVFAGWLSLFRRSRTGKRKAITLSLLILAMGGVVVLALGARGPASGAVLKFFRSAIPPYAMIRQSAKIFCLMPSFLAVAAAIALAGLARPGSRRCLRAVLSAGMAFAALAEYELRSNPTISILRSSQGAYAAASSDAAAGGNPPRALVLPLWPGDSHYASIYQYYSSLYRVRMVNGYNPFIREGYFENVFRKFESVNQGWLSAEQADALLGMNVEYVILHEDLFPEKVSPFPVASALAQLMLNPRLDFLARDGTVWAFRISRNKKSSPGFFPELGTVFPARRFELERCAASGASKPIEDDSSGGGAFLRLSETASARTPEVSVAAIPGMRWMLRARGRGTLYAVTSPGEQPFPVPVGSDDWSWTCVPIENAKGFSPVLLDLKLEDGSADLDLCLLTAGRWRLLEIGGSAVLPAMSFFHAGHADLNSKSVVFRRDHDQRGIVLYGPKLPLGKGKYELEIDFSSPAPEGSKLALANIELNEETGAGLTIPLVSGVRARGQWRQLNSLPFNLAVVYEGGEDMEIRSVRIERIE